VIGKARFVCAAFLVWLATAATAAIAAGSSIRVSVEDLDNRTVAGAQIQLRLSGRVVASATSDAQGQAEFPNLKPGRYQVSADKDGFETATSDSLELSESGLVSASLKLTPAARHESVEVHETVAPIEEAASAPVAIEAEMAKLLPNRPATVADALPMVAGVVREPGGGLNISGTSEHRSSMIVNSADVTDPSTGQFGLTVPMDSVETVNVYETPFLAEYGRFTAGLVSVETRRGGEKWKWELNDPLPEFRIRSYHLRGLKTATPRLNFEGPIVPGKLYFSEGLEFEVRKTAVYELPFPWNQKKTTGVNSFAQLDWVTSTRNLLTATVHAAPQRLEFVNLDYFNPEPTTPDARLHNYTGTISDHLAIFGGLLNTSLSVTQFAASVWGHGSAPLVLAPEGNSGNYFTQQDRDSFRMSGAVSFTARSLNWAGSHNFKIGSYLSGSEDQGQVFKHPIRIEDSEGVLLETIGFAHNGLRFSDDDTAYAFFGQDHWMVSPRLAFDLGLRTESQDISHAFRLAPRAGAAWSLLPSRGTMLYAGFGWFYDNVPLNVYSFDLYPSRVITMYDASGQISAGPFLYKNTLGEVFRNNRLIFSGPVPGNFSPQSDTWRVQLEQPLSHLLKLRVSYMRNLGNGLVNLTPEGPDLDSMTGGYLLQGNGSSSYREFEATARVRLPGRGGQLSFSYVHSRARGTLNDFNNYLGSFPMPVVRPNEYTDLPGGLPNRFLAWGVVPLPWKFQIAPLFEYRTGFPYTVTDATQQYVGRPYSTRFPNFFSLDSRISKDIQVTPKYAVRLSVSSFNLSNHFNPETVHSNVDDPAFGYFFGHRGRRFTLDFDVLF
jgi:hypothetical protein